MYIEDLHLQFVSKLSAQFTREDESFIKNVIEKSVCVIRHNIDFGCHWRFK